MKLFYQLLGASADDDEEALKKAFRKAVKAHHPCLHPDDPDAPARFREIIAAHALVRDAKKRATYDRLLQLERQKFQSTVARHQLRSKLARRRLKVMGATTAVAAVGALVGGFGLFASMPTIAIVEIQKDEPASTTRSAGDKDKQTATVDASAKENETTLTTIAVAKTATVKGDNAC